MNRVENYEDRSRRLATQNHFNQDFLSQDLVAHSLLPLKECFAHMLLPPLHPSPILLNQPAALPCAPC